MKMKGRSSTIGPRSPRPDRRHAQPPRTLFQNAATIPRRIDDPRAIPPLKPPEGTTTPDSMSQSPQHRPPRLAAARPLPALDSSSARLHDPADLWRRLDAATRPRLLTRAAVVHSLTEAAGSAPQVAARASAALQPSRRTQRDMPR